MATPVSSISVASEQPVVKVLGQTTSPMPFNYAQAAGRNTQSSDNQPVSSTALSKKPAPVTGIVPPALPIIAAGHAPKSSGNGTYIPSNIQHNDRGHMRRKSTMNQSTTMPPTPRRTWSQNNAVQFGTQGQFSANGNNMPIQFGSISEPVSAPTTMANDGLASSANLANLSSNSTGISTSTSASPIAPHAGLSGGVPTMQTVPAGVVQFGTVDTDKQDQNISQTNPIDLSSANSHMRTDTVPPTPPTAQIPPQSPRRQHQQPTNGTPNHQYSNTFANGFISGNQQPRGPPRGGPNSPFQQTAPYNQSPHKQSGRNPRPYQAQSPAVTPQPGQAQMAMNIQQAAWYPGFYPQQYPGQQYPSPDGYYYTPQNMRYGSQPAPQAQPFYPQQDRGTMPDQSPRVGQVAMPAVPSMTPAASPPLIQRPVSKAIRIIDPTTHAEVKIAKEVSTPTTPHATVVATAAAVATPERVKTPIINAPALGHSRQLSSTTSLSEDQKRERTEKAVAEAREKIIQSMEKEKREKEEAERKVKEEAERIAKAEEDARLQKEEEERLAKEKELEAERIKKEEEELARAKEEEAKAEEARVQAEKEAEEALARKAEEEKVEKSVDAKEATDDETPLSTGTPATPESIGSPTLPAALPNSEKSALSVDTASTIDSSFAIQLKKAEPIKNISDVSYPEGIVRPALNLTTKTGSSKLRYDPTFLLQFQSVVTGIPTEDWDQRSKNLQDVEDGSKRPSANRTNSSTGRQGARASNISSMPFAGMGQLGSMGQLGFKSPLLSDRGFPKRTNSGENPLATLNRTPSFGKMGQNMMGMPRNMRQNSNGGNNRGKRTMERTPSSRDITPAGGDFASGPPTPVEENVEPLTLSANRWKPRASKEADVEAAADGPTILLPDVVQRKVNGMLNKMTLEKFDKISDQIIEIASQAKYERDGRTLRQVIELTFEKATDEAHWSNMYARFCRKVHESLGEDITEDGVVDKDGEPVRGGALFRKYLLNKCQEKFEKGWSENLGDGKEAPELLSDDYYKVVAVKRRGLGLVRFVGELYMLDMISERVMHRCVQMLLVASPSEEEIESLCGLLTTIGYKLESERIHRDHMEAYFQRLQNILDTQKLPSRIKFMIMDLIDLRRVGWRDKKTADSGPKTIKEIHKEAEKAQAIKDLSKSRNNSMRFSR
ncbi:hypothetical protein V1512DRAFT_260173 [Lipomyces arxii]|uniref:uncharacterized protein n=1 Tax=Lipomyces arxii TaxID=56418 RepID=UPI0034CFE5B8